MSAERMQLGGVIYSSVCEISQESTDFEPNGDYQQLVRLMARPQRAE